MTNEIPQGFGSNGSNFSEDGHELPPIIPPQDENAVDDGQNQNPDAGIWANLNDQEIQAKIADMRRSGEYDSKTGLKPKPENQDNNQAGI